MNKLTTVYMAKVMFTTNYEINIIFKDIPISDDEHKLVKKHVAESIKGVLEKFPFITPIRTKYGFGLVDTEKQEIKAGLK